MQICWLSKRGHRKRQDTRRNPVSASVRFCARSFPLPQPFEVDGGDVEHDPFEPEDHEETLREGTVADAFSIVARLHTNKMTGNKSEQ